MNSDKFKFSVGWYIYIHKCIDLLSMFHSLYKKALALSGWLVHESHFFNMVRVWYMVSETHTIFLKYKYGNNFTITIEKKILYGNQFSYHYHMKQYIVKIVTILPYNIYSGHILPTPARGWFTHWGPFKNETFVTQDIEIFSNRRHEYVLNKL